MDFANELQFLKRGGVSPPPANEFKLSMLNRMLNRMLNQAMNGDFGSLNNFKGSLKGVAY